MVAPSAIAPPRVIGGSCDECDTAEVRLACTGDFHAEGVHPECDTVEKAIAWRNGVEIGEMPMVLT